MIILQSLQHEILKLGQIVRIDYSTNGNHTEYIRLSFHLAGLNNIFVAFRHSWAEGGGPGGAPPSEKTPYAFRYS